MFIKGDRVRVRLSDRGRWSQPVRDMVDGQMGTVIETKDNSVNGFPSGTFACVVKFDSLLHPPQTYPLRSSFDEFWFPPCDLVLLSCEQQSHNWVHEDIRDQNFHVKFGEQRHCTRCGKKQICSFCEGRVGGYWYDCKDTKQEPEEKTETTKNG